MKRESTMRRFLLVFFVFVITLLAIPRGAPAAQASGTISNVPLAEFVALVAQSEGRQYVLLPNTPNPLITARYTAVSGNDELSRILVLNGLTEYLHDHILYIGTPSAVDHLFGLHDTIIRTIPVNGVSPSVIAANPTNFARPSVTIYADTARNAIIAEGPPADVDALAATLNRFDEPATTSKEYYFENPVDLTTAVGELAHLDPPRGGDRIIAQPQSQSLLLRGTPAYLTATTHDLHTYIDLPIPTVLYNVTVYEVDPQQFSSHRGIQIGQTQTNYQAIGSSSVGTIAPPTNGSGIFGFPVNAGNISFELNELEQHGAAKIIRRITINAANNTSNTATNLLTVPFTVPNQYSGYEQVRTVSTGVRLTVDPIIAKTRLYTNVRVEYSDIAGYGPLGAPETVSRTAHVHVVTRHSSQAIVLSGLYSSDSDSSLSGIPVLDKIPLIGPFFRDRQINKSDSEIVIVLVPQYHVRHPVLTFPHIPASVLQHGYVPKGTPPPRRLRGRTLP